MSIKNNLPIKSKKRNRSSIENDRVSAKQKQLLEIINNAKEGGSNKEDSFVTKFAGKPEIQLVKNTHLRDTVDIYELNPAPIEWNFFAPLPDHKMFQLIESILSVGLLYEIIVWENKDRQTYTILAGHNRVKAYKMILEATDDTTFSRIPAKIFKHEDLHELEAQEIIVDTNFVGRDLKPSEKALSIARKITLFTEKKKVFNIQGRVRDEVAKAYNLSGRQIENYKRLSNLIEPFLNMLDGRQLKQAVGLKIALFDHDMQVWIYDNYKNNLLESNVRQLKPDMTKMEIAEILEQEPVEPKELTKIRVEIPFGLEKSFKNMFEEWVKDNNLDKNEFNIFVR